MDIIDSHLQSEDDLYYSPDEPIASAANVPQADQRMTEYGPVWWSDSSTSSPDSQDEDQPPGLNPPPRTHQLRHTYQPPPRVDSLRPPPGFHLTPAHTQPQSHFRIQAKFNKFLREVLKDEETVRALIYNSEDVLVRNLTPMQVDLYYYFASQFPSFDDYREAITDQWWAAKNASHAGTVATESAPSSYSYSGTDVEDEDGDGALDRAIMTPLPKQGTEEELFLQEEKTAMEEAEEEEGVFYDVPLEVSDGVAVTEEGVEEGRADVGP